MLHHLKVEEEKSRKLLEPVLSGLLLVVDPDERDVVFRAVVRYRLQVFHHLKKLELEIMLQGNQFSNLLVPLGAEEEHSNVVELADKPSKDNISHLKLK